jgi:hypothetical protein
VRDRLCRWLGTAARGRDTPASSTGSPTATGVICTTPNLAGLGERTAQDGYRSSGLDIEIAEVRQQLRRWRGTLREG